MIDDYRFGTMVVAGTVYQADLKIVGGKVAPDWWRQKGHAVGVADVPDVFAAKPQVLVVGQGSPGYMKVLPELRTALEDAGIRLVEKPTDQAVAEFNRLHAAGTAVAGAFHLTC